MNDDDEAPSDESDEEPRDDHEVGLICSFWIDTDAYSDRDRLMFCAGVEFGRVLEHIRHEPGELETTIHRENESRVRLACGNFHRRCAIQPCQPELDPDGSWSYLRIEPGQVKDPDETQAD